MTGRYLARVTVVALALGVVVPGVQAAGPRADRHAQVGSTDSGVRQQAGAATDVDRIREALEREPVLDLTKEGLRFYASVIGLSLSSEKVLGKNVDLVNGPTRGGAPMTHQEFLNMVTPKELYSSGGIRASEMLQWSAVNVLGYALIKKAVLGIRNARSEGEIRAIRERIDRELEALRRAKGGG